MLEYNLQVSKLRAELKRIISCKSRSRIVLKKSSSYRRASGTYSTPGRDLPTSMR